MVANLDMLLSVLPFEKEIFKNTSLLVRYIGNPLVNHIEGHTPTPLPKLGKKKVLGLFPGSRTKEIERNLKQQLITARRLLTINPELEVALSIANPRFCSRIQEICTEVGIAPHFIPTSNAYDLMSRCHLALATSGTVTLELALHNVPTVVTYSVSTLDLIIAKHILRIILPFYGLVNIVAGKEVFPELIGPNLTIDVLFEKASSFLTQDEARTACIKECRSVRALLTQKDASKEAAEAITSF